MGHGGPAHPIAEKPTTKPVMTLLKTTIMFGIFLIITAVIHRMQIDNAEEYRASIAVSFMIFWLCCVILFGAVEAILIPILIIQKRWKSLKLALMGLALSWVFMFIAVWIDSPALLYAT
jgi:uncharacterized membrane protein